MMFSFTDKKNKFVRGIKNLAVCAFALVAVVTASAANPVTASAAEQETKPAQSAEEKKTDIKAPVFKEVQNIRTGYTCTILRRLYEERVIAESRSGRGRRCGGSCPPRNAPRLRTRGRAVRRAAVRGSGARAGERPARVRNPPVAGRRD